MKQDAVNITKEDIAQAQPALEALFEQRVRVVMWMGGCFFPFFSLLDLILARPFFWLFFAWRIGFSLLMFFMLSLVERTFFRERVRAIIFAILLLAVFIITQMCVCLGGFVSGYYVGILLIIAGAFSVLPLRALESLLLGGAMYLIYAACNLFSFWPLDPASVAAMTNNSFFFCAFVAVITIQCYDEIVLYWKTLLVQKNLQAINQTLKKYRGNLESLIEQRVVQLAESKLKFRELYDNIHDLVLLIDSNGTIRMVNQYGAKMLELSPTAVIGRSLNDFIPSGGETTLKLMILTPMQLGDSLVARQMQLQTASGRRLDVEISGNPVKISRHEQEYQLVIRDISTIKEIERQVLESTQVLDSSRRNAIFGLARLAECRDEDTGAHLQRICEYTRILVSEMARTEEFRTIITEAFIDDLCNSAILHDIGKIGISDAILLKPGKLTAEEFRIMQKHTEYGYNALVSAEKGISDMPFLRMGQEITLYHHEQWCGKGYPVGLAGEHIPLSARIVTLADIYDALTSARPYKAPFPHEKARALIVDDIGLRFDPRVVAAFLRREADFIAVNQKTAEAA